MQGAGQGHGGGHGERLWVQSSYQHVNAAGGYDGAAQFLADKGDFIGPFRFKSAGLGDGGMRVLVFDGAAQVV